MKVIGLTGGIASGKSTASAYLRSLGAQIVDADAISRASAQARGRRDTRSQSSRALGGRSSARTARSTGGSLARSSLRTRSGAARSARACTPS